MSTDTQDGLYTMRSIPKTTINVKPLARGIYNLFDEEEKTVLRFGMLPAKKMELLDRMLREKFESLGVPAKDFYGDDAKHCEWFEKSRIEDMIVVELKEPLNGDYFVDCNLRDAVSEAARQITLEIYNIGGLVV